MHCPEYISTLCLSEHWKLMTITFISKLHFFDITCVCARASPVRPERKEMKSGEWKCYHISPAGEIMISWRKSSSIRSDYHIFGIIGKLFKNEREWCLFHADIVNTPWIIQVLYMKISTRLDKPITLFGFVISHEAWARHVL